MVMKREYLKYVKNAGEIIRRNFNIPELDKPLNRLNEMYNQSGGQIYNENKVKLDPLGEEDWGDENEENNIDINEVETIAKYFEYVIENRMKDMKKNVVLKEAIENRFDL
jgi:hypothetical protein